MFSKCSHLLQWVNRVIEETISKDLAVVKKEFHDKYYELKEERMNLIKAKVKEKLGVELEVSVFKCNVCSKSGWISYHDSYSVRKKILRFRLR